MASSDHAGEPGSPKGFVHQALIYGSQTEFLGGALSYVRDGIRAGEPVLVRVQRSNVDALREALGDEAGMVDMLAAEDWYENPVRTRGKFLAWAAEHLNGRRVRVIGEPPDGYRLRMLGEPPWPLASPAGIREWARHEAIINVAFAGTPVTFVCPYAAHALPAAIIEHARSTHPEIVNGRGPRGSDGFVNPRMYCRRIDSEVPRHSGSPAARLRFGRGELAAVRDVARDQAKQAGLEGERLEDIVAAVNEVATNALVHGADPVHLRVWHRRRELVFDVSDAGIGIRDPLVGQLKPDLNRIGGWGLWMARVWADTIEVRSDASGTVVSVHTSVPED
jgi:anti-sigma regulatory factor (Ser/Thr protein kinase)